MAEPLPLPNISNLAECVEDARLGGLDTTTGPIHPTNFDEVIARVEAAAAKLPPLYREKASTPFLATMRELGAQGYQEILLSDPNLERAAGLITDVMQSILQNGEGFEARALDAFQEVISDLYAGFLSSSERRGVEPPTRGATPPLAKFGSPEAGPYTWPVDVTENLGMGCAVVSLPPANAKRSAMAWSTLGHETGGHDILHADEGLPEQLADSVRAAIADGPLARYWAERIDETASDVLGLLNMGPAAGIGLIGYFRGLGAAFGGSPKLRPNGPAADPHPADSLRGYLAASVVRLLRFDRRAEWAAVIEAETDNDLRDIANIVLAGRTYTKQQAKASADAVAAAIVNKGVSALQNVPLGSIQNWRNADERVVMKIQKALTTANGVSLSIERGMYAAHAVSAGVLASLAGGTPLTVIFDRMLFILKRMHDANPAWGPLFVRNNRSFDRDLTYVRHSEDDLADRDPDDAPGDKAHAARQG